MNIFVQTAEINNNSVIFISLNLEFESLQKKPNIKQCILYIGPKLQKIFCSKTDVKW